MKNTIITAIKTTLEDRALTAMILGFILLCIIYCVFVGFSLKPSDLQVANHYTAFGQTNFYRAKWYDFITFIVFGVLVMVMHTVLIVKLHVQGRREIAFLFGWVSLLLVVIAFFMTQSILRVAFL
ncbi:MAG TPA: hypothetical protein VIQ80_00240 [Candidatus Saccharimonadales bacterium]